MVSQKWDMKINPLPSKTWNWLGMNETNREVTKLPVPGKGETVLPEKIRKRTEHIPALMQVKTGMGADMDRLMELSKAVPDIYETEEGASPAQPLRIRFKYRDKEHRANVIGLHTAPGSRLTVVMDYASDASASGEANIQTKIVMEKDSRLRLVQIQRLGDGFDCMNDIGAVCGEGAALDIVHLVLGGGNTYQGCLVELIGKGSALGADIGYRVKGKGRLDMNYVAVHEGKRTVSRIETAGVLRDEAFKLFRGTIDFKKGASGAAGSEKEDVLLLDDTVVNQTIPLILCAEEDVEGDHGATIGRLDENLLFYMESRGMEQEEIYELMAKARIQAVCSRIPDAATREEVGAYLEGGAGDSE